LKKILVIRFSSLGDVLLASSVLQPLYERSFSIDFLTLKPFNQLFEKDYRIDKVLAFEKKRVKNYKRFKKTS